MRQTDEQLRDMLDPFFLSYPPELVRAIVEELLERRAADRNADNTAAEMRRWNGEE